VHDVADRLAAVRERIRVAAAGDRRHVTVLAVTKGVSPELVAAARAAGVEDFGENRAPELLGRRAAAPDARWHFLGAVQRRKVRDLAPAVACWQSVDRLAAGREISRHAPGAAVLVQVNVTGQPGRNGCSFDEAPAVVDGLRALGLVVRGLMAVGDPGDPRPGFRRLATAASDMELPELSMGMSGDLDVAVQEGSTTVRVGQALFGPRPGPEDLRRYPHPEGGW